MPNTNDVNTQLTDTDQIFIFEKLKKAWDEVLLEKMKKAVADKREVLRAAFPEIAIMEKATKDAELKKIESEKPRIQLNQQPIIREKEDSLSSSIYYGILTIFGSVLGKAVIGGYSGIFGGALVGLFTGIVTNDISCNHSYRKKSL